MIDTSKDAGFSAVELLITLFIAATFLIGGYQVWIQVVNAGTTADRMTQASNAAYEQVHAASPTGTCTEADPVTTDITVEGLTEPTVTITIDCPLTGDLANISRTTATVTYGPLGERESVSHAIYSK